MSSLDLGWLRSTLGKLLVFVVVILGLSSTGFYYLELMPKGEPDFLAAVWWTVVTLTTVGYGDYVPVTPQGRVLGTLVMLSGIGLVSTLTGNLASLLVERQAKKRKGLLQVKLSGHIVILGWNSYGLNLVQSLLNTERLAGAHLVLVNDLPQEVRDELSFMIDLGDRLHFVYGSHTQQSVVVRAKPETSRVIYILSPEGLDPKSSDQQTTYAALTARSMAPKVPIYGEVVLAENREHLLRAGVDEIVVRGELASHVLGLLGHNPSALPFIKSIIGMTGHGLLDSRAMTEVERAGTWGELVAHVRGRDKVLPLALCVVNKNLGLQDILDSSSALDQYILELFQMYGQKTDIGQQASRVLVNPADDQLLEGFDGFLFLRAGRSAE